MRIDPWILSSAIIDAQEEKNAAAGKEEQPNKVHLLNQLEFCFSIDAMFGGKSWWVVCEVEENEGREMETSHKVVGATPSHGSCANEGPCNERPTESDDAREIE